MMKRVGNTVGKGEIALNEQFLHFQKYFQKNGLVWERVKSKASITKSYPFPKRQILDSSNLKEFADNNFKFDKSGRKLSTWEENTEGKGEIACYEQFLLLPQCFQKPCTADT